MTKRKYVQSGLVALLLITADTTTNAGDLSYSLNLEFNTTADFTSGGEWTVVAKAEQRGLQAGLILLTGVTFDLDTGPLAPARFYDLNNQSANPNIRRFEAAGFNLYASQEPSYLEILIAQDQLFQPVPRWFFDVGVIGGVTQPGENGTPDYPPGVAERQVPWGGYVDNPLLTVLGSNPHLGSFTGGVVLATGTFDPGNIPGWFVDPELSPSMSDGNLLLDLDGNIVGAENVFTTVRFVNVPEPSSILLLLATGAGIAARTRWHD